MGRLRKYSGVQRQIDAQNTNAANQAAAVKEAAAAQQADLVAQAKAAADQQQLLIERQQVEQQVAEIASAPVGVADVALTAPTTEGVGEARRRRRAEFGVGYNSGVRV
jgi:hypothetical protein